MALPQWELNLLKIAERVAPKTEVSKTDPEIKSNALLGFDEAQRLITTEMSTIFESSKIPLDWLFASKIEKSFISDLVNRLCTYQRFRNGYTGELRDLNPDHSAYAKRSDELRQEFIRQTHTTRIETWIRNLDNLFEHRLSGAWGKALAHDLAAICRSHGEGGDFIRSLETEATYFGSSRSNLQSVALLLRVADIVDFSAARAPTILLREKLIRSQVSRDHWDVKNEGISYTFDKTTANETVVRYSAYFQNPKLYFLFQDYLDEVDAELFLYNQFRATKNPANKLLSPIALKADRDGIRYDSTRFEPITGLLFSLDQKRILELLMGIKLYKEPFACLRELYQNALDATRCMLAAEGSTAAGRIEFGLQTDSSVDYLFCRDNGVGMTRDIVSRFLLKVGNSYYQSKEYQRLAASWNDTFTPVSQFGVGILSCFMIGTRMEIISKPVPGLHDDDDPICFVIDGPHEHFYYKPVEPADLESVGKHGTIIKLILSEKYRKALHTSPLPNLEFWQHAENFLNHHKPSEKILDKWRSHLYQKISGFIGDYPQQIDVCISLSDGTSAHLARATTPFDFVSLGIPRTLIETLDDEAHQFRRGQPKYLSVIDHQVIHKISASHLDTTFSVLVGFPKPGFPFDDTRTLNVMSFIEYRNGLLVDGIKMSNNVHSGKDMIDSLSRAGILNFFGRKRPILSVDRLSIVEWPDDLSEISEVLADEITSLLLGKAIAHAKTYDLAPNSTELRLLWDYLFTRFGFLAKRLVEKIIETPEANYTDAELSTITGRDISLSNLANATELTLKWTEFWNLKEASKRLVLGKLSASESLHVVDAKIRLQGPEFLPLAKADSWDRIRGWSYLFRADKWTGTFQEFDLVSMVWPVLSPNLFDKISDRFSEAEPINNRTKSFHHVSNGISAIGDLDPVTIHQKFGIYRVKNDSIYDEKPESVVHRFDQAANSFWLFELEHDYEGADPSRLVFCAYIGPRKLSARENEDLEPYRIDDPDYARGVAEGWSILFLGLKDVNVVCLPGLVPRQHLVDRIPSSFWNAHADVSFYFPDGERLESVQT